MVKKLTKQASIPGHRKLSSPSWRNSYQQLLRYEFGWTDRLMDGLTETRDIFIYFLYILGFNFYSVIIVNQLYCGCCDMLSMYMDEKHHHLVIYPVCEVHKTDFCMIWPQYYWPVLTSQSCLLAIWQLASYKLSVGWLSAAWLSAGYWLAIVLSISYLLAGYWLAIA